MYVDVTFLSITYSTNYLLNQLHMHNMEQTDKSNKDGERFACHIALVTTARLTKAHQNLHSFPVVLTASEAEDFTACVLVSIPQLHLLHPSNQTCYMV